MYLFSCFGPDGFVPKMIQSVLLRVYRKQRYGKITQMTTTIQSTIKKIFMVDTLSKYWQQPCFALGGFRRQPAGRLLMRSELLVSDVTEPL